MRVNIRRPPKNPEREQRIRVEIEPHDVWDLDWTLAQIIHPALVMLKSDKHGAPNVDSEDVPEHLQPSLEDIAHYEKTGHTDKLWFERHDYIIDEMIWTFDQLKGHVDFHSTADTERINNGLRLFGKYYRSLWT